MLTPTQQDIHAFAVDPKHQGRGAGAALVQTLIDLGDSTGLPIYLESSAGSQGLYRKMGFMQVPSDVARVVHDAEVLQAEKDVEVPLMIKLPAAATSPLVGEKDKTLEDVYLDWYALRDSTREEVNGCKEIKV
jgi:predicted acetyltransferase